MSDQHSSADFAYKDVYKRQPERVAIENDIDAFADKIWTNLNENNKISLYVRYINIADGTVENRMFNKNA